VLPRLRFLPDYPFARDNNVALPIRRRGIIRLIRGPGGDPLRSPACPSASRLKQFSALARSPWRTRKTKFKQDDYMKYLLMIVAALALMGTANATSRFADCCGGGTCCLIKSNCCAK
jgi:hypothetical protein